MAYTCSMPEMMRRIIALLSVSFFLAYAVDFFAVNALSPEHTVAPLVIIDHVRKGEHRLSGYLSLPTECHAFSTKVTQSGEYTYLVDFSTWQDSTRECSVTPVSRRFEAITFAPSVGVHVGARVDGVEVPVHVIRARTP